MSASVTSRPERGSRYSHLQRGTEHAPGVGHLVPMLPVVLDVHLELRVRLHRLVEFVRQIPVIVPNALGDKIMIDEVAQLLAQVQSRLPAHHLGH